MRRLTVSRDLEDTPPSAESPAAILNPDAAGGGEAAALCVGITLSAPGAAEPFLADATSASAFAHTPGFLLDVQISVSVEVGRIPLTVREVLSLAPGQVIELQRSASEPVEVHANGRCIGRGEIVVVGEQFGVRITELGAT
jgi:flagellar motor switch protein FliN/FliY